MVSNIVNLNADGHDYPKPYVLIWFSVDGCETCKDLAIVMDMIKYTHSEKLKVIRIDSDQDMKEAKKFSVKVLPTMVMLGKNGVEEHLVGAYTYHELCEWLEDNFSIRSKVAVQKEQAICFTQVLI